MLYCETLASPPDRSWRVLNNVAVLSDLERLFEADFENFARYSEIVAVNLCVYVSKKALGTSIRNTFELHLSGNGSYRKRLYMRQNQP